MYKMMKKEKYAKACFYVFRGHMINIDLLPDNYVAVDVGASYGMLTHFMINNLPKKPKVIHAFEPCKQLYNRLYELDKKYPFVKTYNMAVGGQRSDLKMLYCDCYTDDTLNGIGLGHLHSNTNNLSNSHNESVRKQYEVDVIKINDLLKVIGEDHIDYLCIDVEGEELEIVDTMSKELAEKVGQIVFEIHIKDRMDSFKKKILELGFKSFFSYMRTELYGTRERLETEPEKCTS